MPDVRGEADPMVVERRDNRTIALRGMSSHSSFSGVPSQFSG